MFRPRVSAPPDSGGNRLGRRAPRGTTQGSGTINFVTSQILVVLVGAALSLCFAWLIGNTLAARLEREKKLTERDVNALTTFQELYGTFFAVWKEWGNSPHNDETAARLLPAAAGVEGRYEALLVLVCSERSLTREDRLALGALRQGLQQLREAIKARGNIQWWSSEDRSYRALKTLTTRVAVLLRPRAMGWAGRAPRRPDASEAASAFMDVTVNRFETNWVEVAEALTVSR